MIVNWKKNLFFVWLSQIFSLAGFSGIMPFIPLFIRDRYGVTDEAMLGFQVSMLNFFGFLSFCGAAVLWGFLADRFGRKMMLLRACFVTAVLFPLLNFAPNIYALIAIRFLVSAFSGTVTAAQTLVSATTPEEHQGFALGMLSTALWSGNLIGFVFGSAVVSFFGYFWGFAVSGISFVISGLLVLFFVREDFHAPERTRKKESEGGGFFSAFSGLGTTVWLIMGLCVMMGLARRFDEPYLAIMIGRLGDSGNTVAATGIICTAAALGGILSGALLGKLCDKWNPLAVAWPALLAAAAASVWQGAAGGYVSFGLARFIAFFAAGGLEPAFLTLLSKSAGAEKRGMIFGLASSLRMFGILLASLLGGGVIWLGGVRAVFFVAAALFLAHLPLLAAAGRGRMEK